MRAIARVLSPVVTLLSIATLVATLSIRPELLNNYSATPAGWVIPVVVAGSLAGILYSGRRGNDRSAFLSSCAYIVSMLAGAAFALYPTLLPATTGTGNSLTIHNAAAGPRSLELGLLWWIPGMLMAIAYFVLVYRMFAGKVSTAYRGH